MTQAALDRSRPIELEIGWPWWRPVKKNDIAATPGAAVTASRQVMPSGRCCQLLGWSFAETTALAGASFRLHDGFGTSDQVLVRINLSSNESTRDRSAPPGITVTSGAIFLEILSGSVEGVLYWI